MLSEARQFHGLFVAQVSRQVAPLEQNLAEIFEVRRVENLAFFARSIRRKRTAQ